MGGKALPVFKLDRVSVEGRTETRPQCCPQLVQDPRNWESKSKRQNIVQMSDDALLNALVGSKHITALIVDGIQCECLLDTGSQVTTVSESFHKLHLPSRPILSLRNLLDVEGAGGQAVPYLGYVELSLCFPEEVTGKPEEVCTLALVVPDCKVNVDIPVLVGTNVLHIMYEAHLNQSRISPKDEHVQCTRLIKAMYRRDKVEQDCGKVGKVKLLCKQSVTVQAGQKVILKGYTRNLDIPPGTTLVVEPLYQSLPGGLIFCSYLTANPAQTSFKVPILMKNESNRDIKVTGNHDVAELYIPLSVSCLTSSVRNWSYTNQPHKSTLNTSTCNNLDALAFGTTLQFDFSDSPLSEEWKNRITQKLNSMSDVFATHDLDYGHTTAIKHHIRLSDPTPFKQRPRPIHPSDFEAVGSHLKELCDAHIIRESESPFASPVVVVKKKNGAVRLRVDYRKLNNQTIKDAYALPNIEEAFAALTGSRWFSVMDLKSGFYQVEVEEEDKHKTAFVTPVGFWEFNRMPQGVMNAPSTFQRVMEKCMGNLNLKEVLVFLDDLIVF